MKISEIRKLATNDLAAETVKLRAEITVLRRQLVMGEISNTRLIRNKRRDLARMLTVLSEQLTMEIK